jgi:hypothetical protein
MAKLYDKSGNAVEAFTQEEVNAQIAEHPTVKEAQQKVTEAEAKVADLTKKLEEAAGSDKNQNFAALRDAKDKAEKDLAEMKANLVTGLDAVNKRLNDAELRSTFIQIAGGDEELAKKIQTEYESIVKADDTDEVKREKMGKAYKIAAGLSASPSVFNRVLGSAGAPPSGGGTPTYSPELVNLGARFGLTPEDFAKFGKKK